VLIMGHGTGIAFSGLIFLIVVSSFIDGIDIRRLEARVSALEAK